MRNDFLTRDECTAMRGIAILAIMLHNYCHFIGRIVKENEYQFFTSHNEGFWQVITNPDNLLPVHLLSYFGHYGVPVFLFLSGFGLVKKYEQSDKVGTLPFVRYNYLKLLRMLIVGFTIFVIVDALTPGRFQFHWYNVIAQLLMYINVLPTPDKIIWPGIYWFFGLMMELYIVYRLLLYRRNTMYVIALVIVCWLMQIFCDPEGEILNRLRYNFIGGMLPFGLGILFARIPTLGTNNSHVGNKTFPRWEYIVTLLVSTVLIVAMSFWYQSWFFVPVFVIIGTIALVKVMPKWMLSVIIWVGTISAAMFVTHPIVRKIFITVAWKQDIYDGLMLYVVVTIALSWAVKQLIDRIPKPKL
ncbi:MAG: acyltransferase [Prevotella sp.]|nr:acyltransferase [Prevotella sp.]